MAWDISEDKLENLGADVADPGIDWAAIAEMVAAREEAEKETAESEAAVATEPSISDRLRQLADEMDGLA